MSAPRGTHKPGSPGSRSKPDKTPLTAQSPGSITVRDPEPCVYKGSYICDGCGTTRRAPRFSIWASPFRDANDMIGRAEHRAMTPLCASCRNPMRLLPQGIKLRRYLRKIRRQGS